MALIDHIIVKVDDLQASVAFYTDVLGIPNEGTDGPFTVIRVGPNCQLQLAPWGTAGFEHYAFAVSRAEFDQIAWPNQGSGYRLWSDVRFRRIEYRTRRRVRGERPCADALFQ